MLLNKKNNFNNNTINIYQKKYNYIIRNNKSNIIIWQYNYKLHLSTIQDLNLLNPNFSKNKYQEMIFINNLAIFGCCLKLYHKNEFN